MILEKSFVMHYDEATLFKACQEAINLIPKQEFQIINPELKTIHSLLYDYPMLRDQTSRNLWSKESSTSIFMQVIPIDAYKTKLEISLESFLVPYLYTVGNTSFSNQYMEAMHNVNVHGQYASNRNYLSASCQFSLAAFLELLTGILNKK